MPCHVSIKMEYKKSKKMNISKIIFCLYVNTARLYGQFDSSVI